MDKVGGRGFGDLVGVFVRMIPVNVFQAAAEGQFLAIIFFAVVFGYFMARVREEFASPLGDFWEAVYRVMMKITLWVIRFAPLGVFALVGKVVMSSGLEVFKLLFWFFITVLAALAVHFFVVLPLILRFVARLSPLAYLRAMLPAVLMAFSTASSSSTLPLTMNCARNRVGASNRVSGFVLPLGATVNMDGTALYECVAVLFIAQVYGVEMSLATQIVVVLLALADLGRRRRRARGQPRRDHADPDRGRPAGRGDRSDPRGRPRARHVPHQRQRVQRRLRHRRRRAQRKRGVAEAGIAEAPEALRELLRDRFGRDPRRPAQATRVVGYGLLMPSRL